MRLLPVHGLMQDSRRRRATPLIAGSLLVTLLCYGLALYQQSMSQAAQRATAIRDTAQVAPPHEPTDPAKRMERALAWWAGYVPLLYHAPAPQPAAMAPLLSDGPPALRHGSRSLPPRSLMRPATGTVPRTVRASLHAPAGDQHRLLALSIVAGAQTSNQGLILADMQPAAAVGDVPARPSPTPTPAHHLAVWVTGYTLTGITALGTEAGPGTCAVDPAVIPLGTRITIEGLGSCVAQDTGPEVIGAHIDVWVPTVSEAYALTGWRSATW